MANTTWSFIWITIWGATVSILANRVDRWIAARGALVFHADFGSYFEETRTSLGLAGRISPTTVNLTLTASNRGKENITISYVNAKLDGHTTMNMSLDPEEKSGHSPRPQVAQRTLEPGGKRGRWSCPITYAEATRLQSIILTDGANRTWSVHHTTITRLKARARTALKNQQVTPTPEN